MVDIEYLKKMDYYMDASRDVVEQTLKKSSPGSFVVRPSSQPSCIAISHKVSDGTVAHALIHCTNEGFRLEKTTNPFPSLELLIMSIKKHFNLDPKTPETEEERVKDLRISKLIEMVPWTDPSNVRTALQICKEDRDVIQLVVDQDINDDKLAVNAEDSKLLINTIEASVPALRETLKEVGDALDTLRSHQARKKHNGAMQAVLDIRTSLGAYPQDSSLKMPTPLPLPAIEGTPEAESIRTRNTHAKCVWEIQSKLSYMQKNIATDAYKSRLMDAASVLIDMRTKLSSPEIIKLLSEVASANAPPYDPASKNDAEFYVDLKEISLGKEIGKGNFGKVYKAKFRKDTVAVKVVTVKEEKELKVLKREISLLRECHHKNITELMAVAKDGSTLYLVMEFVEKGDLYALILDKKLTSWVRRISVARDVAAALAHMHSHNLLHRDIKSENMLVTKDFTIKLCDLGFSRAASEGVHRYTMCGSIYFNAPEVLLGKAYNQRADCFAFGVWCFEIITNAEVNLERTKKTMFGFDVDSIRGVIPKDCPPLFWRVAALCCSYEPERRPTCRQSEAMLNRILELQKK